MLSKINNLSENLYRCFEIGENTGILTLNGLQSPDRHNEGLKNKNLTHVRFD